MIYSGIDAPHPMLSEVAKELLAKNSAQFAEHQRLAEHLLGYLSPPVTVAAPLANAQLSIALQINWQLHIGLDPFVFSAIGSGKMAQTRSYRDDVPLVNPYAGELAALVLFPTAADDYAGWDTLRSLRGPQQ